MRHMTNLSSSADLKELGKTVIATRVQSGKVPAGCLGVSIEGNEIKCYRECDEVRIPLHGKLWWVHVGPYMLEMAPVESVPEAGVRLLLEVPAINEKVPSELILWLHDRQHPTLKMNDVASDLHGHPLLHLPPCVQHEERREIARSLSSFLLRKGLICRNVDRIDLYPSVNCAAMPVEFAAGSSEVQSGLIQIGNYEDDDFGRRLFIELPLLANRLRSFSMPKDNVALALHLKLLRHLELIASTTGRLPEIGEQFGRNSAPPDVARRLHMEARRAVQKLDEAWSLVGDDAEEFMLPARQRLFARKLAGIEESIARRRAQW